ncbi:MAG: restriction endonuclease subunit S [Akkermansia sp.]|nr:restriction endonuclease subunit S [Akkermansia sp.]
MGMKAYPTYKDSGVQWLAEVPSSWNVFPAKQVFADSKERRRTDDTFLTASQKYGVISQQRYMQLIGGRIVQASQDFDKWKHVEPDDFVISLRSFQGGLEMCAERGCVTWHYVVLKPKMEIIPLYFKWLFKSFSYIKSLQSTCNFIRDGQDLRYSNFVQVPIPFPPLTEQKTIASFLDKKCAEIEKLISRRQSIIERLRELKQSIIAEAVTKGLNPDVPLKESSSEWLGQVPKHWELDLLKKFCSPVKYKNSSLDSDTALQFRYGEIIEKSNIDKTDAEYMKTIAEYTVIHPNNIIINGLNMNYDFVSQRVAISTLEGVITSAYLALDINQSILPKYLTYQLKSFDTQKLFHGLGKGIRLTLTYKILSRILIAVPPSEEQKEIVNYLDKKCAKIDELISRHEQTIEKLKELKTATIAHVVTGKMDVRDAI